MLCARVLVQACPRMPLSRCMASGRNSYVSGGSNPMDISPEVRELVKEARDPEDKSWQLGHGIQQHKEMNLATKERTRAKQYEVAYYGYEAKVDNGVDSIKYWPMEGDDMEQAPPSPVLMVNRVKSLNKEPYYIKDYCEQIGLGHLEDLSRKVFLPNLPSVGLLLYRIKHLVKITPVTFPQGMPEDFDPDKYGYKLKQNGEFIVTPTKAESIESIVSRAEWMKLSKWDISKEARRHWKKPFNSPLGNSNYHADNTKLDRKAADSEFVKNKATRRKWS